MNWNLRTFWMSLFLLTMLAPAAAEQLTFTSGDWRPYIFEENGTIDSKTPGFSIEVVNTVFVKMGHDIVYATAPFLRQIRNVEQGKNVALVGVYREEAPNLIFPEEPIGMTRNCFYVKKDSNWKYEGVDNLSEVTIAVIGGYTYGEIDDYIASINSNIMSLKGNEADMMHRLTRLVDVDRATAFVQDVAVTEYFLKTEGMQGRYRAAGCMEAIPSMLGFAPNDSRTAGFVKDFDRQLVQMRASGELKQILDKYGISDWK
jgi:polar amino acid transport system substrate-binding protein